MCVYTVWQCIVIHCHTVYTHTYTHTHRQSYTRHTVCLCLCLCLCICLCILQCDSVVIPSAAVVYAQVVTSSFLRQCNTFEPIHLPNGATINPPVEVAQCSGSAAVHDLQLGQVTPDMFTALTAPIPVFRSVSMSVSNYVREIRVLYNFVACRRICLCFVWQGSFVIELAGVCVCDRTRLKLWLGLLVRNSETMSVWLLISVCQTVRHCIFYVRSRTVLFEEVLILTVTPCIGVHCSNFHEI